MIKNLIKTCMAAVASYGLVLVISVIHPEKFTAQAMEMCQPQFTIKSPASNTSTMITFKVTRAFGSPVNVYWIDFNGKWVFYKKLNPGQSYTQPTFSGHEWVVQGDGNCGYETAQNSPTTHVVDTDNPYDQSGAGKPTYTETVGGSNSRESYYASMRGWRVFSGRIDGRFAYCVAERSDNGALVRLGYNDQQWQLSVPVAARSDWEGELEVDDKTRMISGGSSGKWTVAWLGLEELGWVRNGNTMILNIGRVSYDASLSGSAAAILKVKECWDNGGNKP